MHSTYGKCDLSRDGIVRASCCNVFHPLDGVFMFGVLPSLTCVFLIGPVIENGLQNETCTAHLLTTYPKFW